MSEFQVKKNDLSSTRVISTVNTNALNSGQIKVKIDAFSFTANNITYWAMGDQLGYWQFFPASDNTTEDWGLIPVWGFADVVESKHENIAIGERIFGYFPPASECLMEPTKVMDSLWFDGTAHRQKLPSGYNMYRRVHAEPGYNQAHDSLRMLLFPLHITSFCIHDMLSTQNWFGAEQILIISASSKTSLGLAFALKEDPNSPAVIGMTSTRNQGFVNETGYYDESVTYEQNQHIDASKKTVIVDMACNGELLGKIHSHLGDNMLYCSNVGLTHWGQTAKGPGFNKERSHMFFAPAHIQQRYQDWGAAEFENKSATFMQRAAADSAQWLEITPVSGLAGLAKIFGDVSQGTLPAKQGLIIKL